MTYSVIIYVIINVIIIIIIIIFIIYLLLLLCSEEVLYKRQMFRCLVFFSNEIASLKKEVDDLRVANNNSNRHRRDSINGTSSLHSDRVEERERVEREAPQPKERLSRRSVLKLENLFLG